MRRYTGDIEICQYGIKINFPDGTHITSHFGDWEVMIDGCRVTTFRTEGSSYLPEPPAIDLLVKDKQGNAVFKTP